MVRFRWLTGNVVRAATLFIVTSCGSDDSADEDAATASPVTAGDASTAPPLQTPAVPAPPVTVTPMAPQQEMLRVELARDASGTVSLLEVSSLHSELPTPPISPSGDAMVVAYAGDKIVGVDMARFARSMVAEDWLSDSPSSSEVKVAASRYTALFPISAAATRVVLTLPDGSQGGELAVPKPTGDKGIARIDQALSPLPFYPHIQVLGATDQALVPADSQMVIGTLIDPLAGDLQLLQQALKRAAPSMLLGVRNIGFTTGVEGSTVWGLSVGPAFLINAGAVARKIWADPSFLTYVINHELAHCYASLVDNAIDDASWKFALSSWNGPLTEVAAERIQALELSDALTLTWYNLHQTGVDMQRAQPYTWDDRAARPSADQAVVQGFATPYGSVNALEDLAEFAAQVQVPEWTRDSGGLCQKLQSSSSGELALPLAIAFAKLAYVNALGLVSPESYEACIGGLSVVGPNGIHLTGANGGKNTFDQAVRGGSSVADGQPVLDVFASDATYQCLLEVDKSHGGLGMHRLDAHSDLFVKGFGTNTFLASDTKNLNFASTGGLVLVTRLDAERLEGLIFLLTVRNAFFTTDAYTFGTFRVDKPRL